MRIDVKKVWKILNGNQKPSIEEGETIQWAKEKQQKDKQRSKKYYPPQQTPQKIEHQHPHIE
jgi:hypothetical protein